MYDSVRSAFGPFSAGLEGIVPCMYLDMHRNNAGELDPLVTTGIGNLIDPIDLALPWPWLRRSDGQPATQDEIVAEWTRIKQHTEMAPRSAEARKAFGALDLNAAGVDALFAMRLGANEKVLRQRISNYDAVPADAQLAIHSMAWAMGPGFRFPNCIAAIEAERFADAATLCFIPNANQSRNNANELLFKNAATVAAQGSDRAVLLWSAGQ
jgi:hypothetical protein